MHLLFSSYSITKFPCRYRQKAGFAGSHFAGPWEPATLTRLREIHAASEMDLASLNMAAPLKEREDRK